MYRLPSDFADIAMECAEYAYIPIAIFIFSVVDFQLIKAILK